MDNEPKPGAPLIPAGTEPTVYGQTTYPQPNQGQALASPEGKQAIGKGQMEQALQAALGESPTQVPIGAGIGITFEELAQKKGFKSPDDLARAYSNLESDNTKARMSLAELIQAREPAPPQSPAAPESEEPIQVQTEADALRVVQNVVKKLTRPLEDRVELTTLFVTKPDALQYAAGMAKAVKENSGISWETAYKLAKYEESERRAEEQKQQGRQEAYQTMEQKGKMLAGAGHPTGTQPAVNLQQLQGMIMDRSIPFSEVQRIMRERFSQ